MSLQFRKSHKKIAFWILGEYNNKFFVHIHPKIFTSTYHYVQWNSLCAKDLFIFIHQWTLCIYDIFPRIICLCLWYYRRTSTNVKPNLDRLHIDVIKTDYFSVTIMTPTIHHGAQYECPYFIENWPIPQYNWILNCFWYWAVVEFCRFH